jgi:hypothetical protein
MFELINDKLNFHNNIKLEVKKIEIKDNKVKLVFLDKNLMKVKTMRYEMDWIYSELKLKKVYFKPFKDKYFR